MNDHRPRGNHRRRYRCSWAEEACRDCRPCRASANTRASDARDGLAEDRDDMHPGDAYRQDNMQRVEKCKRGSAVISTAQGEKTRAT